MSLKDAELEKMSAADRKKALAKRKKAEAKAAEKDKDDSIKASGVQGKKSEDDATASGGAKKKPGSLGRQLGWMEIDPEGVELLRSVGDFLNEAHKYVVELDRWAPKDLDTQVLVFDVALRRNKFLVALRAHERAKSICEERTGRTVDTIVLSGMSMQLLRVSERDSTKALMESLPVEFVEVFQSFIDKIREQSGAATSYQYATQVASNLTGGSLDAQLVFARTLLKMCKADAEFGKHVRATAMELFLEWSKGAPGPALRTCEDLFWNIEELALSSQEKARFVQMCLERFPHANAFGGGEKEIVL